MYYNCPIGCCQVLFAYNAGPLAWSIVVFQNSIVFHSIYEVSLLICHRDARNYVQDNNGVMHARVFEILSVQYCPVVWGVLVFGAQPTSDGLVNSE